MKYLVVQLQPEASPRGISEESAARAMSGIAQATNSELDISRGDDDGVYVNYSFHIDDLGLVWGRLKGMLNGVSEFDGAFSESVIITCEGDHGWDDYYLLHHFDRTQSREQYPD